jgi:glyoxylase I family protein
VDFATDINEAHQATSNESPQGVPTRDRRVNFNDLDRVKINFSVVCRSSSYKTLRMQMGSLQVFASVHHVAVICSNYENSKRFYTETLGFPIINETYREARDSYKLDLALPPYPAPYSFLSSHISTELNSESHLSISADHQPQLELFSFPNSPPRPSYPEALGLRHLAFAVANIELAVQKLQRRGIKSLEGVRIDELTGRKFTFFSDPDGLPLEIYEMPHRT